MMLIGCAISWLGNWYYYLKSNPAKTSVRALLSAAQKMQKEPRPLDPMHPDASLRIAIELIEAFQEGQVFFPELVICARTYQTVGDLLREPIAKADQAGALAGPTLSHAWLNAREKALKEGLSRVKFELSQRLSGK